MLQGSGRPGAAVSIQMCAANKTQGFTQGSTVTTASPTTCCCRHTHVCGRTNQCRVAPRVKGYKGLADQLVLWAHTHVCCRIRQFKVAPNGQGLEGFGRQRAAVRTHIVRAHVSCRIDQSKVAPTDQRLQRFGRPTAAASIHMCVAKCANSGLHPRLKGG